MIVAVDIVCCRKVLFEGVARFRAEKCHLVAVSIEYMVVVTVEVDIIRLCIDEDAGVLTSESIDVYLCPVIYIRVCPEGIQKKIYRRKLK